MIHLEQAFDENVHTLRDRHCTSASTRPASRCVRGSGSSAPLPLYCDRLGLVGKADVVEFAPDGSPYPVEYKHGSRNKKASIAACDDLQLAGQALCLEEMTGRPVPEGALFYATSKRRRVVTIDVALRSAVESAVAEIRSMLRRGHTPPPVNDERCHACSLRDLCQPVPLTAHDMQTEISRQLFDPDV